MAARALVAVIRPVTWVTTDGGLAGDEQAYRAGHRRDLPGGGRRARLLVDQEGRQVAGALVRDIEPAPVWADGEGAGRVAAAGHPAPRGQAAGAGVDLEPGDRVLAALRRLVAGAVAPVGHVQEPSGGVHGDLGRGAETGEALRQGGDGLPL